LPKKVAQDNQSSQVNSAMVGFSKKSKLSVNVIWFTI
jgi:hypothetical protein